MPDLIAANAQEHTFMLVLEGEARDRDAVALVAAMTTRSALCGAAEQENTCPCFGLRSSMKIQPTMGRPSRMPHLQ